MYPLTYRDALKFNLETFPDLRHHSPEIYEVFEI